MDKLFPEPPEEGYGENWYGSNRPHDFQSLLLVPKTILKERLLDMVQLGREPHPWDTDITRTIGGLPSAMPFYASAMGGTGVGQKEAYALTATLAKHGIITVLGENIANVAGYRERKHEEMPCFQERLQAYWENAPEDIGGVVIQQSVEDANDELWQNIYVDPQWEPYFEAGRMAFEIKLGQGAKPGLGGLTMIPTEKDGEYQDYYVHGREWAGNWKERYSMPGTFTEDILTAQVRKLRNDFPKVKVWVKLPPTQDADKLAQCAIAAGAATVTFDGHHGGSGWAPSTFLNEVGLPLTSILGQIKANHILTGQYNVSGGLQTGGDIMKAICLGSNAVGLTRSLLQAQREHRLEDYLQDLETEIRTLTYALGELHLKNINKEYIYSTQRDQANHLGINYVYAQHDAASK